MEHYAHALAELDACRITRGGLFLEAVHTEQLQRFARAYRALPTEKFETVGSSTDPVAVRTLVRDDRRYLYLVNREYYPIRVEVKLSKAARVTDLATGKGLDAPPGWHLTLGPYELRSFALESTVQVSEFGGTAPPSIVAQLRKNAETALDAIERLRAADAQLPTGTDRMATDIRAAVETERHAWLRRALHSYIVRKCGQLSAALEQAPAL